MGRHRIKIARLEKCVNRQMTFTKRKLGIAKKVKDLTALCDVDVAVLMYSPTGKKATVCLGGNRDLTKILERYSNVAFQEREGRIRESLDHVKKMMRKIGHHVDTKHFTEESVSDEKKAEKLKKKLEDVKKEVTIASYRLRSWESPGNVTDMKMLDDMENTVRNNLAKLRLQKESMLENDAAV